MKEHLIAPKSSAKASAAFFGMALVLALGAGSGPACTGSTSEEIETAVITSQAEFCYADFGAGPEGGFYQYSIHCKDIEPVYTKKWTFVDKVTDGMIGAMSSAGYEIVLQIGSNYVFRKAAQQAADPAEFAMLAEYRNETFTETTSTFSIYTADGASIDLQDSTLDKAQSVLKGLGFEYVQQLGNVEYTSVIFSLYKK